MPGFDCEFMEPPSKDFPQSSCPVCLLVLRELYQATCCGKSFCKECIEQVKVNNQACPTCNDRDFNLFHNKGLQQSLYDFRVYCSHKSVGCEWTGELRELDKHLNSDPPADKSLEGCPFTVINCPFSHTGCEVRLPRKDVEIHMNDELLSHVMKQTALLLTLTQDNQTLNTRLQSVEEEKQHLKQCVAELDGVIKGLEGKIKGLEGEIKGLREAQEIIACTGQPIVPVVFTMTHFQQHKQKNYGDWYSQPFYTHPHGYKMCICVWPNGFAVGKGTHLGVTIHFMRGESDDRLKWPFRGSITIKLLNQEEDKDHVEQLMHFTDNTPDDCTNRVTKGERNVKGWGWVKLLSLANLKRGYLKNDCLKFCITKVVLP